MRNQGIVWTSVAIFVIGLVFPYPVKGAEIEYKPLSPELVSVPQNLLNLIHTGEVQAELKLSVGQQASLEELLREIDGSWWPARNLPPIQQRKIVAELESRMIQGLAQIVRTNSVQRLRQIELQSQSARALARPEIAKFLRLDSKQNKLLNDLFAENDRLASVANSEKSKGDSEKMQAYLAAKNAEPSKALAVLAGAQANQLRTILGSSFDTAKLERIYPLAPELIDSGKWTSETTATLESLRGQVVLVHFYAFQCHNCVANFSHYKRWDETLSRKGVRVIGIQTPETPDERDATQVIKAAKKENFQFPVLIDLENKNWNAWGNTMWPTVYVIDKKGYIRFWWQGELNWQGATGDLKIEKLIDQLLSES